MCGRVGLLAGGRICGLAIAPLLLVVGCWNGVGSPTGGGDPGIGGGTGSVACNGLQAGSTFVRPANAGTTPPPAPTGGSLAAGSYHLATTTYYPMVSCNASGLATTLVIASASETTGTFQMVTGSDGGGAAQGESLSFAIRGTSLSVRIDCITNDTGGVRGTLAEVPFTATPSQLQLYVTAPTCGTRVDTYQKD